MIGGCRWGGVDDRDIGEVALVSSAGRDVGYQLSRTIPYTPVSFFLLSVPSF